MARSKIKGYRNYRQVTENKTAVKQKSKKLESAKKSVASGVDDKFKPIVENVYDLLLAFKKDSHKDNEDVAKVYADVTAHRVYNVLSDIYNKLCEEGDSNSADDISKVAKELEDWISNKAPDLNTLISNSEKLKNITNDIKDRLSEAAGISKKLDEISDKVSGKTKEKTEDGEDKPAAETGGETDKQVKNPFEVDMASIASNISSIQDTVNKIHRSISDALTKNNGLMLRCAEVVHNIDKNLVASSSNKALTAVTKRFNYSNYKVSSPTYVATFKETSKAPARSSGGIDFGLGLALGAALPKILGKALLAIPYYAAVGIFNATRGIGKAMLGLFGIALKPFGLALGLLSGAFKLVMFPIGLVAGLAGSIFKIVGGIAAGVFKITAGIFAFIPKIISGAFKTLTKIVSGIWTGVKGIVSWTKTTIFDRLKTAKGRITLAAIAGLLYGFIIKPIKEHGLTKWAGTVADTVWKGTKFLWNTVADFTKDMIAGIKSWWNEKDNPVCAWWNGLQNWYLKNIYDPYLAKYLDPIIGFFNDDTYIINKYVDKLKQQGYGPDDIIKMRREAKEVLQHMRENIPDKRIDTIGKELDLNAKSPWSGFINWFNESGKTLFTDIGKWFKETGSIVWNWLKKEYESAKKYEGSIVKWAVQELLKAPLGIKTDNSWLAKITQLAGEGVGSMFGFDVSNAGTLTIGGVLGALIGYHMGHFALELAILLKKTWDTFKNFIGKKPPTVSKPNIPDPLPKTPVPPVNPTEAFLGGAATYTAAQVATVANGILTPIVTTALTAQGAQAIREYKAADRETRDKMMAEEEGKIGRGWSKWFKEVEAHEAANRSKALTPSEIADNITYENTLDLSRRLAKSLAFKNYAEDLTNGVEKGAFKNISKNGLEMLNYVIANMTKEQFAKFYTEHTENETLGTAHSFKEIFDQSTLDIIQKRLNGIDSGLKSQKIDWKDVEEELKTMRETNESKYTARSKKKREEVSKSLKDSAEFIQAQKEAYERGVKDGSIATANGVRAANEGRPAPKPTGPSNKDCSN